MRTTIDINDAILKELRQRAQKTGRSFRDIVEQSMKLGLAQMDKPAGKPRVRIKTHPMQLKPGFHGVSLNQLYDQLEAEQTLSPPRK